MNADARARWWRAPAIIFPSAFERIERHDKGSQSVAANTLLALDLIWNGARSYLERRCVLVDEAQVRERIERTGVSDAKKRASYPLAKRAGARCAF